MFQLQISALPQSIRDLIFIEPNSGCWLWLGYVDEYGRIKFSDANRPLAHRYVWEWFNGAVPEGEILHHECRTKFCVNPSHVALTTRKAHRSLHETHELKNHHSYKTHCPQGHPYSGDNLVMHRRKNNAPSRRCRICARIAKSEYYRTHRAELCRKSNEYYHAHNG